MSISAPEAVKLEPVLFTLAAAGPDGVREGRVTLLAHYLYLLRIFPNQYLPKSHLPHQDIPWLMIVTRSANPFVVHEAGMLHALEQSVQRGLFKAHGQGVNRVGMRWAPAQRVIEEYEVSAVARNAAINAAKAPEKELRLTVQRLLDQLFTVTHTIPAI
jgi:hypothetical protein